MTHKISLNVNYEEVHKAVVKPFSTGAHIPFSKKYLGRTVYIVIPKKDELSWIFKQEYIETIEKAIKSSVPENRFIEYAKNSVLDKLRRLSRTKETNIHALKEILEYLLWKEDVSTKAKKLVAELNKKYNLHLLEPEEPVVIVLSREEYAEIKDYPEKLRELTDNGKFKLEIEDDNIIELTADAFNKLDKSPDKDKKLKGVTGVRIVRKHSN